MEITFRDTDDPGARRWQVNAIDIVPIPPAALLLGSGLLGMGAVAWRRRKKR